MIAELRFYLRLLPRRLPVMILLFLSASLAGVIVAQRLPAVYSTSATLLVESAQISDGQRRPQAQSSAAEQLQVIQQQLLTRSNLIEIANEVQVFEDQASMTPDQIVRAMRSASNIRLTIGRDQATLMRLNFSAGDPVKVADVVNRYVDIALESSTAAATSQAEDTRAFYEQEVQKYSDEIDAQSSKIATFKSANADALPENLEYNQNRQSLLQERISRAERELESIAIQRNNIMRVFQATGSVTTQGPPPLTPEESLLQQLTGELSVARSIYSDSNPRVRTLQAQIDALEERIAAAAAAAPDTPDNVPTAQSTALEISLAEIDSRTTTLTQEIADAQEELVTLRDSIERTPANGIVLDGLDRELENIQDLYNASVGRLAQAQTSLNIVAAAKGERVTVLEAASVPTAPSSPSRLKIGALGIAAGLGLAGGFFFLLELLNQTVRRPSDIVKSLEITPLATIPRIETKSQKRMRRILQVGASLVVLTSVPAALWAIDTYFMPLDLLYEKIKGRLT
jgi:uncharacterized protein involved in exopolysaccharide biosynthesis